MTTAQKQTYADAPTKVVGAADGYDYAYRDVGGGTVEMPLSLLVKENPSLQTAPSSR